MRKGVIKVDSTKAQIMEEFKPHLEVWSSVNIGGVSYMSLNGTVTSLEHTLAECPFQSQTNNKFKLGPGPFPSEVFWEVELSNNGTDWFI